MCVALRPNATPALRRRTGQAEPPKSCPLPGAAPTRRKEAPVLAEPHSVDCGAVVSQGGKQQRACLLLAGIQQGRHSPHLRQSQRRCATPRYQLPGQRPCVCAVVSTLLIALRRDDSALIIHVPCSCWGSTHLDLRVDAASGKAQARVLHMDCVHTACRAGCKLWDGLQAARNDDWSGSCSGPRSERSDRAGKSASGSYPHVCTKEPSLTASCFAVADCSDQEAEGPCPAARSCGQAGGQRRAWLQAAARRLLLDQLDL